MTDRQPDESPANGLQTNGFGGPNGALTIPGVVLSSHTSYQQAAPPTPPPQRPSLPGWLIALIAGTAAVVLLGILAVFTVPVFLDQRAKAQWRATSVSLPAGLGGQPRNTTAKAQLLAKSFANQEIPVEDVAIYGTVGSKAVILLAVRLPTATNRKRQDAERASFERSFTTKGGGTLRLVKDSQPDPLGGWLGCGTTPEGAHVCLATDDASMVAVITGPTTGDPFALARQARAATVTRN